VSIEFAGKLREGRLLYVLIPLLILHLALLSIQIEDPTGIILLKRWVLRAGAPFLNASSSVSHGVARLWTNYFSLRDARADNDRLVERVRQLNMRDNALSQMEAENVRLRSLLSLKETLPIKTLGARVVSRAPSYLANVLYIDRGTTDGVRANAAVLADKGVLGRISLVTPNNSQVQLISNADASIGVIVERTRSPGVLSGSGNALLELRYISNFEEVNAGDVLLTSGLDGIYPKGLPVGKVLESRKGKSVFRVIHVEPNVDLSRVEEVLVVIEE
jgi:rod shape-determining protein MreC